MRISPLEARIIKQQAAEVFGPAALVRLFGSRVDNDARGGDIDLLISTPEPIEDPVQRSARLAAKLAMAIGEQRLDILVMAPNTPQQPIHQVALQKGVVL